MNRKKIWIVVAMITVVLGIVLGVEIYGLGPGRWKKVTILTATEGGTYYPLGQCLAQILAELPGQPIKDANAIETDGSMYNIERLLDPEDTEDNVVAFAMASVMAFSRPLLIASVIRAAVPRAPTALPSAGARGAPCPPRRTLRR